MRDPQGRLRFEGDAAIREVLPGGLAGAFLNHPLAQELVRHGVLVPFEWQAAGRLVSPRLPLVSLPFEWCDAQFRAAAMLTLDVAGQALREGFELKDASAWNVVFDGVRPMFCDHLSFEPIRSREWWAFGQFCRHFLLPLAGARQRGLHAGETFAAHRDGMTSERARALLGPRGLLSRVGPLLWCAGARANADAAGLHASTPKGGGARHAALIQYGHWCLGRPPAEATGGAWAGYVGARPHYSETAAAQKRSRVGTWLAELRPPVVLDLGANTGEFSRLALEHAQRVVAVDADHDCIENLFRSAPQGRARLHPMVANLADLGGGRGWAGSEFAGLHERLAGQADVVMMLALTHHLRFAEGIPLEEIAALAAHWSRSHLILELLHPDDPMVVQLATQRRQSPKSFTVDEQLRAFSRHFEPLGREALDGSRRELVLMKRCP